MKAPAQASLGRVFCCQRINFPRPLGGVIKRDARVLLAAGRLRHTSRHPDDAAAIPCIFHGSGNTILLKYLSYAIRLRTCRRARVKLHDGNGVLTGGCISREHDQTSPSVAEERPGCCTGRTGAAAVECFDFATANFSRSHIGRYQFEGAVCKSESRTERRHG